MLTTNKFLSGVVLALICLGVLSALSTPARAQRTQESEVLTMQSLKAMLESMGYSPKDLTDKEGRVNRYLITVPSGGGDWKIVLDFSPSQENLWIYANLFKVPDLNKVPREILQGMLKANDGMGATYFAYNDRINFFVLYQALTNRGLTPQLLRERIREVAYQVDIRERLWNPDLWPGAVSTPTVPTTPVAGDWTTFTSKECFFSVMAPGSFAQLSTRSEDSGKIKYYSFGTGPYSLACALTPGPISQTEINKYFDLWRKDTLRTKPGNVTVDKELSITVGTKSYPGRELVIDGRDKASRSRVFFVGSRVYLVSVYGASALVSGQDVSKYFDSFQLTSAAEQPVSNGLVGTVWQGTESLSGFGKLMFKFEAPDVAFMTDASSTVQGKWKQSGNQVTITFGNCVYTGTIQGQTLAGTAQFKDGERRPWTFSVARQPSATSRGISEMFGRGAEEFSGHGRIAEQADVTPETQQPTRKR